ncbi:autophagy protein 5 [Dimargaris verticillata]|uniref:Autophagy protein 5 n=1 Tax=Dimargaris verticillata TaxID=2761393 RepID=A0A9W8B1G4_9FUNG|nr:autophagy protein 5 [Dimargaris verticillata]
MLSWVRQALPTSSLAANAKPEAVWYSHNGHLLKWHYPIGLLYDMFTESSDAPTMPPADLPQLTGALPLPWPITVHLQSFPHDKLLPSPTSSTLQTLYMAQCKEAEFMRTGSTKKIMNLSKNDQSQLWQGFVEHTFEKYWRIGQPLVLGDDGFVPKHIPFRLYTRLGAVVQIPISLSELGETTTIQEAVTYIINPDRYLSGNAPVTGTSTPLDCRVLVHGILVDPATPLLWLYRHFSYPDTFLHAVLL